MGLYSAGRQPRATERSRVLCEKNHCSADGGGAAAVRLLQRHAEQRRQGAGGHPGQRRRQQQPLRTDGQGRIPGGRPRHHLQRRLLLLLRRAPLAALRERGRRKRGRVHRGLHLPGRPRKGPHPVRGGRGGRDLRGRLPGLQRGAPEHAHPDRPAGDGLRGGEERGGRTTRRNHRRRTGQPAPLQGRPRGPAAGLFLRQRRCSPGRAGLFYVWRRGARLRRQRRLF